MWFRIENGELPNFCSETAWVNVLQNKKGIQIVRGVLLEESLAIISLSQLLKHPSLRGYFIINLIFYYWEKPYLKAFTSIWGIECSHLKSDWFAPWWTLFPRTLLRRWLVSQQHGKQLFLQSGGVQLAYSLQKERKGSMCLPSRRKGA